MLNINRATLLGHAGRDPEIRDLKKGGAVLVEGRIATRDYRDRGGNDRTVTEIVVSGPQGTVNILPARGTEPERRDGDAGGSAKA